MARSHDVGFSVSMFIADHILSVTTPVVQLFMTHQMLQFIFPVLSFFVEYPTCVLLSVQLLSVASHLGRVLSVTMICDVHISMFILPLVSLHSLG